MCFLLGGVEMDFFKCRFLRALAGTRLGLQPFCDITKTLTRHGAS